MRLNINVGNELIVQVEGMEERFKAVLVGIEVSGYLIIRIQLPSKFRNQIDKKTILDVRYLYMGNVFGFRSVMLGTINNPFKLAFISYPESVEILNLRKAQRVNCYIPATARLKSKEVRGVIMDISTGGGRFTILPGSIDMREIDINDIIMLVFPLLGIEGVQKIGGEIKSITGDIDKISFGIQFEALNSRVSKKINAYVKDVLDYQES